MEASKLFDELFSGVNWKVGKHTLIAPADLPCEQSLREMDDLLSDLRKETESSSSYETLQRVRSECHRLGFKSACFCCVPADYYSRDLEARRKLLSAPSIDCLCKSLILENTASNSATDESRFFCVIIQYISKLDSQKVFKFVRNLLNGSRKEFHFRMTDENEARRLTGFEHNAISPIGMSVGLMPIILASGIADLQKTHDFFWLGGGQVDLKLGFCVSEFISVLQPHIADIYK